MGTSEGMPTSPLALRAPCLAFSLVPDVSQFQLLFLPALRAFPGNGDGHADRVCHCLT